MARKNETARDRLRKIPLWQWGLFCFLGGGFAGVASFARGPANDRAEAAGRGAAVLVFWIAGLVLIVLHFVRRKKGNPALDVRPKPKRPRA